MPRSTVNAPLPVFHLPNPLNVQASLCSESPLSVPKLTNDIEMVSCEACLLMLMQTLCMHWAKALDTLGKLREPYLKSGLMKPH